MNPVLLLVDDDDAIRTQMKWALSADYEIVSAEDRSGAVETFKKKKPFAEVEVMLKGKIFKMKKDRLSVCLFSL